jgi:hypothetical protein
MSNTDFLATNITKVFDLDGNNVEAVTHKPE